MKICSVCYRCYEDRAVHCAEESHQALLEPHDGDIEIVAGYQLESLHHSAARECVFKARHIESDRSCIIKLFHTNTDRVNDFLRDAEIASSLFHPNVVDIYEMGRLDNGDLFVVTEDYAGQTLREMMSREMPELMTAIRIATEAASAIHTMHLKSLVHRAIRPENIVLTHDDHGDLLVRIKDADLGGLYQHSIMSDKFTIDSARDQIRYFAPEQCNNESISIKTDVYSLGIVLYDMLAGRPPFDSPKASGLIEMHRHRRPAEIKIDDFEVRMLVTHTLMQSLSKHASDRQSSANAFARQLRHVEQLSTHVSTPPPAGIVPPESLRSSPRIHISDAGQPADVNVVSAVPQPVIISENISFLRAEDKTEPRPAPVVEALPVRGVMPEQAPSTRQRLSRLGLRRKRVQSADTSFLEDAPTQVVSASQPADTSRPFVLPSAEDPMPTVKKDIAKIEWDQPDDDIPSMEAVLAVRSEMPVLRVEPALAKVPEPIVEQAKPIATSKPAPARAAAASAGIHLSGIFATSHHAPDEITAVPRGNPIRIEIASPKPVSARSPVRNTIPIPADESSYFPTLLSSGTAATNNNPSASILSAFYDPGSSRFGWPVQKVMLAAGVTAAAVAIFSFSVLLGSRYSSRTSVDSRSEAVVATSSDPQRAAVIDQQPAERKKPLKYFDSPRPNTNSGVTSAPKPDATKSTSAKSQPTVVSKTDKKAATRSAAAGTGKTLPKPDTAKRGKSDRPIAATSNKLTANTRPRIVKNPSP